MRYRSKIPNPAHVAPIGIVVTPGQEFDSPIGLHHPELEPLDDEAKAHAEQIAAELAEHAAAYQARVTGQAEAAGPPVDYRAALGLEPLPPAPEPTPEERRIRGLPESEPPPPSMKPPPRSQAARKE